MAKFSLPASLVWPCAVRTFYLYLSQHVNPVFVLWSEHWGSMIFVFVIGQYLQCGCCQELTPDLNAVQVIYWYKAMLTSGYQGFKGDRHNVVCRVDYLVTNISNWQLHWRWWLESRSWIKAASYRCNFQTVGNVMFAFKVIWSLPVQNSTSAFGRSL